MDPRPAATLILAREATEGVEILALRRASDSRFAPGFMVFPGGVIEPSDRDLAIQLFDDGEEASRACAVRELYEEAGLLLTGHGLRAPSSAGPIEGLRFRPPRLDDMPEVGRWVAPESLEVRFDARFYAAPGPGEAPVPDGREVEAAWWALPADLLIAAEAGELPLMWPTLVMLRALEGCRSVSDVLALRVAQVPRDPRVRLPAP